MNKFKAFFEHPEVLLFTAVLVAMIVIKIVLYAVPDTEPLF